MYRVLFMLSAIMLNVVMLSVIMLNVIMLSVIMPSVVVLLENYRKIIVRTFVNIGL